jgi:hypothetical protein
LNNFLCSKHKIEFKGKTFVRGYTTTEDGGNRMTCCLRYQYNRKWKSIANGLQIMALDFAQSTLGGMLPADAHIAARAKAREAYFARYS